MAASHNDANLSFRRASTAVGPQDFPLTTITSNISSSASVPGEAVFSEGSRSRSNTPSSFASSTDAQPPESSKKSTNITPLSSLSPASLKASQHVRSVSQGSNTSRPTPDLLHTAEAVNSGHRASQALETIPQQASLPPSVIERPGSSQQEQGSGEAQEFNRDDYPPDFSRENTFSDTTALPSIVRTESRLTRWSARPRSFAETVHDRLKHYKAPQISYGLATLTVSAWGGGWIAWRAYVLAQWQNLQNYYDYCSQRTKNHSDYEYCREFIKTPLPPPPYSSLQQPGKSDLPKRALETTTFGPAPMFLTWQILFCTYMLAVGLAASFIAFLSIYQSYYARRSREANRPQAAQYRGTWPFRHQYTDPFSPVNVRIQPRHTQPPRDISPIQDTHHTYTTGSDEHPAQKRVRYRRVMPVMPSESFQSSDTRRKSLKPNEALFESPSWKHQGSLADLASDDASSKFEITKSEQDISSPEGSAYYEKLGRTTSNDSSTFVGALRKKLHSKYPDLPYYLPRSDDTDDVEPPLTALGADPDDDEEDNAVESDEEMAARAIRQRKNIVLSGFVAMGVAQSGAALAATAGGAIGKHLLVQNIENESDMLHNILQSGVSRTTTREEDSYRDAKSRYVSGESKEKGKGLERKGSKAEGKRTASGGGANRGSLVRLSFSRSAGLKESTTLG